MALSAEGFTFRDTGAED